MKNPEFSNTFTTLLNSYNTQAAFGEQASRMEIVLDEYEKSVLLTQAQDIIVKSYFDATTNAQGQGFDDSVRRQVDFSSLIKVAKLKPKYQQQAVVKWEDPINEYIGTYTISNLKDSKIRVVVNVDNNDTTVDADGIKAQFSSGVLTFTINMALAFEHSPSVTMADIISSMLDKDYTSGKKVKKLINITGVDTEYNPTDEENYTAIDVTISASSSTFDDRGIIFEMPRKKTPQGIEVQDTTDVLFILNEKLVINGKDFVIVHISYKEYDREMSKPYAQPLKKQAWRLFQNTATGFDVNSELIPKWNADTSAEQFEYKIRYVKRPRPIILEAMPSEDLAIDGIWNEESECELNPILHMDILNKAVELAIATRGGAPVPQQSNNG